MDRNRPLIGIAAYEVPASFSHWSDVECAMVPAGYVKHVVEATPIRRPASASSAARAAPRRSRGIGSAGSPLAPASPWVSERL